MEYLEGLYGDALHDPLHRDDKNGLEGLQTELDAVDPGTTAEDEYIIILFGWAARWSRSTACSIATHGSPFLWPGDGRRTTAQQTLDATINWDNDNGFALPGAPPNGSDYVRLHGDQRPVPEAQPAEDLGVSS